MSDKLKRTIIGAVIAVALAAGVSYGLISQQTADDLQQKANQSLATDQQAAPANPEQPAPQAPERQDGSDRPPAQPDAQTPPPASRP